MTPEQIKAAAKEATDNWLNPLPTPVFSNAGVTAYGHDCHQIGVEAGIKRGLEAKIQMEPLIVEREDTLSKAILISDELESELLELRGFKELATKQLRDVTEQLLAFQSKCIAYEGELEKKDEHISRLNHVINNFPNQ